MSHDLYLASLVLALLCAGCASTTWVKASATDVEMRKDLAQCEEEFHDRVEFRGDAAKRAEMSHLVEQCMIERGYEKRAQ
jgi:hypothetical protein